MEGQDGRKMMMMEQAIADKKSYDARMKGMIKTLVKNYEWDDDMEMPFEVGEEGEIVCYKNFHFYIHKKYKKTMTINYYFPSWEVFKDDMERSCWIDVRRTGETFPQEHYERKHRDEKFMLSCWKSGTTYARKNPNSTSGLQLKTKKVKLY